MRAGHAVAGVALGVIDVVVDDPELRQPVQRHQEVAAPGVVHLDVFELGERLEHLGTDDAFDIGRSFAAVVHAAAVQQPVVARQAIVVEQVVAVLHCHVVGQQAPCELFAERLGGDDLRPAGHGFSLELRHHAAHVGVAGHDDAVGPDGAAGGLQRDRGAMLEGQDRALLVNHAAQRFQGGCLAQRQIQRMKVAAGVIDQHAGIAVAADLTLVGVAFQQFELIVAVTLPQRLMMPQGFELLGVAGGEQVAVAQVALDAVGRDALADHPVALERHVAQSTSRLDAVLVFDHVHVAAVAVDDLAAIAPRGAIADARGFQHDHLQAFLGQMQRRRQAGESGAHHAHVAADIGRQRRARRRGIGRGRIPGSGIFEG